MTTTIEPGAMNPGLMISQGGGDSSATSGVLFAPTTSGQTTSPNPGVIPATYVGQTQAPVTVPTPTIPTSHVGVMDGINAGLTGSAEASALAAINPGGTTASQQAILNEGQTNTTTSTNPGGNTNTTTSTNPGGNTNTTDNTTGSTTLDTLLQQYLGGNTAPPSSSDAYAANLGETGAQITTNQSSDQANVNDLTAQLNNINAQAQSAITAQGGRFTTTGMTNGATASIERSAALQALPISAQLQAAQGNLTTAQSQLDKYFSLQQEDATNTYNFNQSQRQAVYQYATAQQQAQIAAQQKTDDQTFQVQQANATNQASVAKEAMTAGQANIAGAITKLNPSSPTFNSDLASLESQIQDPNTALDTENKELTNANLEQNLQNGPGGLSSDDVSNLLETLNTYKGQAYITPNDLTGYTAAEKSQIITAAKTSGTPTLTDQNANTLDSITSAQSNLSDFSNFINTAGDGGKPVLPKQYFGQPLQLADVNLNKYLSTNNQLSGFNSWKLQVIPLLSALKGAGSGSGGAGKLFNTVDDLLPVDTDTVGEAETKIANINNILSNGANSILGISSSSSSTGSNPDQTVNGVTYTYNASDGKYYPK